MDEHALVSAVKGLALELGRTPTRREFEGSIKGANYQLNKFGGYLPLLRAAGLESAQEGRQAKISNAVFTRDLERHLEAYEPLPEIERKPWPRIATISDIHWPFSNNRVVDRFCEYVGDVKPEHVIVNGDAWDMYSHSKFPRSHNLFTPRQEQEMARKANEQFWERIQAASPRSQCTQMMGNHDIRPLKRILESYPEAEDWISEKLKTLFSFKGVKTIHDAREELMLGDIAVFHGYRSQLGAHRDYTLFNTVNGHTHKGGVVFRRIRGQTLWELNSGLAGDPEAKGLTYTPQKITDWTPGFGIVDPLGPRFIPV